MLFSKKNPNKSDRISKIKTKDIVHCVETPKSLEIRLSASSKFDWQQFGNTPCACKKCQKETVPIVSSNWCCLSICGKICGKRGDVRGKTAIFKEFVNLYG